MSRFSSWLGADLSYALKNTAFVIGFLAAANACGGGGCGSSCGGSSVIPGGFAKDKRVENAAGVRVTRSGLDFLQTNLPTVIQKVLEGGGTSLKGGIMTFEIPKSNGSYKVPPFGWPTINYSVCSTGPMPGATPPKCIVEINIAKISGVTLKAESPNKLTLHARIPIRLQRLPIDISVVGNVEATLGKDGKCNPVEFLDVDMDAVILLQNIPDDAKHTVRAGYTKIFIDPAQFTFNKDQVKSGFNFCGSGINDTFAGWFKGMIADQIVGQLGGSLVKPLAEATCMKAQKLPDGTEQCPTGTFNKGGTCRYEDKSDGECVPMLLGMESRFDLSGLLASMSPGTSGGLDFMLASGGDMKPAPGTGAAVNGITLGMLGGAQPVEQSLCVPKGDYPLPSGLQLPDVLLANEVPDWTAPVKPHLGIGMSEAYLNHAAAGAYNSGAFCIGISSEQISQLNAGLFSLLLPSIKGLSDKFNPGDTSPAMALAIRPQQAPNITIGNNTPDFTSPLLNLKLQNTDLDFYMWSHERFVRLFTGRIDIGVPINLESGKDGIGLKFAPKTPLQFTNPRISNNTLLLEKEAAVGKLVESIGGLIPASTFSSIKPFKVDSALASYGLKLTIPEGGIRKIDKDDQRWLGIFAYLETTSAAIPTTKTTAQVVKTFIDPKNFVLETVGDAPPRFDVHATSDLDNGTRKVEYAYKVDNGPYTTFFPERDFTVTSPFFLLQGKHTISVVSRVAGVAESEGEPVVLPVLIDVLQPRVLLKTDVPGAVQIVATDIVSRGADLKVDARIDGGQWVPVPLVDAKQGTKVVSTRVVSVPVEATNIEVRATDEAGNVASTSAPLIRGRADATVPGGSGCGCTIPKGESSGSTTALATFGALAMLGAIVERRRRRMTRAREVAMASMIVAASGASGCTCASGDEEGGGTKSECNGKPDLVPYVIGSHTSVAEGKDGTIWVAGYYEGDPSGGSSDDFHADLVIGKFDKEKGAVAWQTVDGVPKLAEGSELIKNSCGFRGGVTDPGDDVGQFTAMVLDSTGNPIVAYFDRTNSALKVARGDGKDWATHTVQTVAKGWAGKFNSMTLANGKPVIAFQTMEAGSGGYAKAKVRVAKAQTEAPSAEGDWVLEDVAVEEKSPCIPDVCASGQKCLVGDVGLEPVCTATAGGCSPACGDGEACVKNKDGVVGCQKTRGTLGIYVNAIGSGISLSATASGELGVVFYDRVHGNIRASSNKGGKWTTTPTTAPLDGWTGDVTKNKTTGDRGIGASLAIDPTGNWHVVYADGIKEWLLYKFVPGGDVTKAAAAIVIDDGTSVDGSAATAFKDGQHVIGENAHLVLDGANLKLVYQDSTAGALRWAKGPGGAGAKFTRGTVKQDGFAGFWPRLVSGQALNFFRMRGETENMDPLILGNVRAVPLP
ncbi:MAG: hypothetical protein HYV09_01535 [Deltaproteobacteria bacterium]|nr:hypothetical protein [Deltaproteobacteria bacterium]